MSIRVLVVDDEVKFADLLQERLQFRGVQVSKAYSGNEALQGLDATNPDMVVLIHIINAAFFSAIILITSGSQKTN